MLHPDTVSPAVKQNIPIHVKNSLQASLAGTAIVGGHVASERPRVCTVTRTPLQEYETRHRPQLDLPLTWLGADREGAYLMVLVGLNVMDLPRLEDKLEGVLREAGVAFFIPKRVNGSPHSLSAVVAQRDQERVFQIMHKLVLAVQQEYRFTGDLCSGGAAATGPQTAPP